MRMERLDEHLKQKLKDPYFNELYELDEQKLAIVKRIIDYRITNKLTQGQLAKRAGITQQHISKIENGEFSNITTLEKVLLFIGFTVKLLAVPLQKQVKERILHLSRQAQQGRDYPCYSRETDFEIGCPFWNVPFYYSVSKGQWAMVWPLMAKAKGQPAVQNKSPMFK